MTIKTGWTPERRAAAAERMRRTRLNATPEQEARRGRAIARTAANRRIRAQNEVIKREIAALTSTPEAMARYILAPPGEDEWRALSQTVDIALIRARTRGGRRMARETLRRMIVEATKRVVAPTDEEKADMEARHRVALLRMAGAVDEDLTIPSRVRELRMEDGPPSYAMKRPTHDPGPRRG